MDVDRALDDDDDDADDLEWSLGFLERPIDVEALRRHHFPSKAGGAPAWLDPVRVPYEEELRTARGERMDFLLQVYAPVDEEHSAFHRTIYVFVSPHGGETHEAGGARAFRGQLPRANAYYDWNPTPNGGEVNGLGAALEATRRRRCDWWDVSASECETTMRAPTRAFEEYELVVETEERADENEEELLANATEVGADMSAEDLEAIEQEVVDKDMEQLATFHVMLHKDPEQVLRYCPEPGAKPTWPSVTHAPNTDNIPSCARCGAPRKFEFQILPTLVSQLGVDSESDYALDFGSMAVYTCSKSCPPIECDEVGRRTGAYAEEYIVVHPPLNQ